MDTPHHYAAPQDFTARVDEIRQRALTDKHLAEALRSLLIDSHDYARGVLSVVGLERLASDYASSDARTTELAATVQGLVDAEGRDFVEAFFRPDLDGDALRSARAELQCERARYAKICALIEQVKSCGYTPDYDGAPC